MYKWGIGAKNCLESGNCLESAPPCIKFSGKNGRFHQNEGVLNNPSENRRKYVFKRHSMWIRIWFGHNDMRKIELKNGIGIRKIGIRKSEFCRRKMMFYLHFKIEIRSLYIEKTRCQNLPLFGLCCKKFCTSIHNWITFFDKKVNIFSIKNNFSWTLKILKEFSWIERNKSRGRNSKPDTCT